jgi:transposase-like protein
MSASVLNAAHFHNEAAAYKFVESRVWPEGPVCPHCGGVERIGKLEGKSTRPGVYKCYQCRKPFTVKVGTVFESSHIKLHLWLQAMFLMASSKKGISANQLHRTLGVTLKTAWFMAHRLRLAMQKVGLEPMGGAGEVVEVDETYIGKLEGLKRPRGKHGGANAYKNVVLTLVQRGGEARSFHVAGVRRFDLGGIINANVKPESVLMTDEFASYRKIGRAFASHEVVNHSREEYVRYEGSKLITTNTVEGFYSIFKRGMKGVYQHCSEKHLHRYLAEFDFRYSNRVAMGVNDVARAERMIKGIVGKRLTYQTTN